MKFLKMKTLTFSMVIVAILFCSSGYADSFFIELSEFEKRKIDYLRINPINLTYDGSCFVACEKNKDLQLRAKGFKRCLRVFKFADNRLADVRTIQLPLVHWVNGAVSDRRDEVCILANRGTKVLLVDLKTEKVLTLWEHQKGKQGFKAGPGLLCNRGRFYATGWFYDSQQYWKGDYLARFLISRKKSKMRFHRQVDLDRLFNRKGGYTKAFYYISGEQILFNFIKPKERKMSLMLFNRGRMVEVDKGYMLMVFIGMKSKVFYSVMYKEKPKVLQHFIKDMRSGRKWKIGDDKEPLTYPFFAGDGKIFIVIKINNRYKKQSAYYGLEKDGYKLKKFLHRVPIGPMKISGNGKHYLLMSPTGIRVGRFEDF